MSGFPTLSTLTMPATESSFPNIWNFIGRVVEPNATLVVGMVIRCALASSPSRCGSGAPHCTRTYCTGFVAVFDGCLSVTTLYDLWYDTVMSRASPKVALSPK